MGDAIKGQEPRFFLGAAANPFADPFDFRPYRLAKKVKAGADFIQTQFIFNVPKFQEYMRRVGRPGPARKDLHPGRRGAHQEPGRRPVHGHQGARHGRGSGIHRAHAQLDQGPAFHQRDQGHGRPGGGQEARAARKEAAENEGIKICVDIINACKEIEGVAGVHIMAIEWEEAVDEHRQACQIGPKYDPARQSA